LTAPAAYGKAPSFPGRCRRRTVRAAVRTRRGRAGRGPFFLGSLVVIKAEWGMKRQCPKCGTRFYDLMQDDPVTCINCGNAWVPEPILKSKQTLTFETAKADTGAAEEALTTEDLEIDEDNGEPSEDSDVDIGGGDDLSEVVVDDSEEER
jgi:uncharacterized protein (TIGR02300 family)